MARYFKKFDTRVRVMTGAGFYIPFEQITDDSGKLYDWGVLETTDGYIAAEIEKLIARQAGGVAEISQADYESLKKKENLTLLPFWRALLGRKQFLDLIRRLGEDAAAASRAAQSLPDVVRGLRGEKDKLSRPLGISTFRPGAVTR